MTIKELQKAICSDLEMLKGCNEELHQRKVRVLIKEQHIENITARIYNNTQEIMKLANTPLPA